MPDNRSFLSRLFGPRRPKAIASSPKDPLDDFWYSRFPHRHVAGVYVTPENALEISAVWACVDSISKALASCPWRVITYDRTPGRMPRKRTLFDDPLTYLLDVRPNKEMTAIAFRECLLFAALIWGDGIAELQRDLANRVVALWPILPDRVSVRRLENLDLVYDVQNPDGSTRTLRSTDVYHLHGPGIHGLCGDNMVSRMARTIALAAAQERFASTYFGNNTILGGVIETPKILNEETVHRMQKSWEEAHKGPDKAHRVAILENGTTYKQLQSTAEAAQLLEARKFQILEICRFYGVPPHKVMEMTNSTYSNIEHQSIEWVRDGLTPWVRRLEQEADYKLFPDKGVRAGRETELETKWLTQGDAMSRAQAYRVMRETGVYSVNEIRAFEGDNDIGPEGDIRLLPLNMQTYDQLILSQERAEIEVDRARNPEPVEDPDQPEPDDEEEPPKQIPANNLDSTLLLRSAIVALFSSVFERYAKRIANRTRDLQRSQDEARIAIHIANERARLRPWIVEECLPAKQLAVAIKVENVDFDLLILRGADAVDNGRPTSDVAADIVASIFDLGRVAA